jgi:hypothetical protein
MPNVSDAVSAEYHVRFDEGYSRASLPDHLPHVEIVVYRSDSTLVLPIACYCMHCFRAMPAGPSGRLRITVRPQIDFVQIC